MEDGGDIIEQIVTILNQLKSPDPEVQNQNFVLFQEIHQNFPEFCFLLLHIISSVEYSSQIRLLALIVLHRNHKRMINDIIPAFLEQSKPIMLQVLQSNDEACARFAITIIISQLKLYGPDIYPEIFHIIFSFFQNQSLIPRGFDCLKELCFSNLSIPMELLELIPLFVLSEYGGQALEVCRMMYESQELFINRSIMPIIVSQYERLSDEALQEAAVLAALSFSKFGENLTGEFLSLCLMSEKYEIVNSAIFTLNDQEIIPAFPKLIIALMHVISIVDQDYQSFGIGSCAQVVLQDIAYLDDEVNRIVKENLNECVDIGHYLRCLYSILSTDTQSMDFLPIILEHLNDECRAEAAMCLMSICHSNQDFTDQAISFIIPLNIDQDPRVQFFAIYALQNILSNFQSKFTPKLEHFAFLIDAMKSSQEETLFSTTELVSLYALQIYKIETCDYLVSFTQELIDFFLNSNVDHLLFSCLTVILTSMINHLPFGSFIMQILNKIRNCLDNDDENMEAVLVKFATKLVKLHGKNLDGNEELIIISHKLRDKAEETDNNLLIELIFTFGMEISINSPSIFPNQAESWLKISLINLSCTNIKISSMIAEMWMNMISLLDVEVVKEFLRRCYLINNFKVDRTYETETIKQFAVTIIIFMLENNIPIEEEIKEFYDNVE